MSEHAKNSTSGLAEPSVEALFQGIRRGDRALLARALTLVESTLPRHQLMAERLLSRVLPLTGKSRRIGVTGMPGAGKSTFIEAAGLELVSRGERVAVLAIDPSSGISGGSILADKTRMTGLAAEAGAFIRPSPAAGRLGGIAERTQHCLLLCEAAGFDSVFIETLGVGQSEDRVVEVVDCVLVLMLPNAGDELQAMKRGLLERADVIAVNKADGPLKISAEVAAEQLRGGVHGVDHPGGPMVLTCSALHREGIVEVLEAIERRISVRRAAGDLATRRSRQQAELMWEAVERHLMAAVWKQPAVAELRGELERRMFAGELSPGETAAILLSACGLDGNERDRSRADSER